ncbi:hypothetical protein SmJEL517_g03560 [Synchytrium microbalum]|uniref:non-specific serine/threonine protein kinase n=1 Tax=Synchytrium microbalum TaxID=1806994 RepID=A0A507C2J0_9FUNG|nr:uncharacterized protein SmJEL517_g03560 [Synchytrium microbalum]TPX33578.1 hypothetical protein SmJEL517_g03560 [Synchytrium microbalum]
MLKIRYSLILLLLLLLFTLTDSTPGGPSRRQAHLVDRAGNDGAVAPVLIIPDDHVIAPLSPNHRLPSSIEPGEIVIVNTLDGGLHGINKITGSVLWSHDKLVGPMVRVDVASSTLKKKTESNNSGLGIGDDLVPEETDKTTCAVETDVPENIIDDEEMGAVLQHVAAEQAALPSSSDGDVDNNIVFIPEPTGQGNLYLHEPGTGQPIKKLPYSIKWMVEKSPFRSERFITIGRKVDKYFSMDASTGKILHIYTSDDVLDASFASESSPDGKQPNVILLGQREYSLSILDRDTRRLRWNISYTEFTTADMDDDTSAVSSNNQGGLLTDGGGTRRRTSTSLLKGPEYHYSSGVDGTFLIKGVNELQLQFESPPVAAFSVNPTRSSSLNDNPSTTITGDSSTSDKYVAQKSYPPPAPLGPNKRKTEGYIGVVNKTYYIMSSASFPNLLDAFRPRGLPSSSDPECVDPKCLIGSHIVEEDGAPTWKSYGNSWNTWMREFRHGRSVQMRQIAPTSTIELLTVWTAGIVLIVYVTWRAYMWYSNRNGVLSEVPGSPKEVVIKAVDGEGIANDGKRRRRRGPRTTSAVKKQEQQSAALLKSLTVTEEVLGYGSHGTVVYRGSFENRDVAIKRLLLDFYEVAHHEVKVLQDSDHHPNVVRYYCQEKSEKFMYIALELCPASLADVIESPSRPDLLVLRQELNPARVLYQIMAGLHHLHTLKIVHRDIKPQNILISSAPSRPNAKASKNRHPRILISDFGLCKRLADDQSSFQHTVNNTGGTLGWRAAECMPVTAQREHQTPNNNNAATNGSSDSDGFVKGGEASEPNNSNKQNNHSNSSIGMPPLTSELALQGRITKSIDVFSAGCVFYYVLSNGEHPFGDRYSREVNVLRGLYSLDALDGLGEEGVIARDLVERMIQRDSSKRPDAAEVLTHPYFWSPATRLSFLQDVSDRFEVEQRDPPSPLLALLEANASRVVGTDWYKRIDKMLLDNLGKYRKYDGASKHHYQDLPDNVKRALGSLPDGFLSYFTSRFPMLVLHVYDVVKQCDELREDGMFRAYFSYDPHQNMI